MDFFWIFWVLAGVSLSFVILCFCLPAWFLITKNMWFFVMLEIKSLVYMLHTKIFREPPNITVRLVPIEAERVNTPKNGWSFADCPQSVWVRKKIGNFLEVEVGSFDERLVWYCWPSVDFCVGRNSGRIQKLHIKYRYIRNRGQLFRNSCGQTDWAKYFTSVVMAHLEVLKFSQLIRSHHPTLISRIFKEYGENFFQEVV